MLTHPHLPKARKGLQDDRIKEKEEMLKQVQHDKPTSSE